MRQPTPKGFVCVKTSFDTQGIRVVAGIPRAYDFIQNTVKPYGKLTGTNQEGEFTLWVGLQWDRDELVEWFKYLWEEQEKEHA
jgi:hypothetical protein